VSLSQKQLVRDEIKKVLFEMGEQIRRDKSERLAAILVKFMKGKIKALSWDSVVLGCYFPFDGEPDWTGVRSEMPPKLSFSRIADQGEMSFHLCGIENLCNEKFGKISLKAPPVESVLVVPDVLLIPGMAFTSKGDRLGRGGGYYDRYCESKNILKIALCFEEQIRSGLPTLDHDIKMDAIITDERIISCSFET